MWTKKFCISNVISCSENTSVVFQKLDMTANIELELPVTSSTCGFPWNASGGAASQEKNINRTTSQYTKSMKWHRFEFEFIYFLLFTANKHIFTSRNEQSRALHGTNDANCEWISWRKIAWLVWVYKIQVGISIFNRNQRRRQKTLVLFRFLTTLADVVPEKISKPIQNGHTAAHLRIKRIAKENI